jgi:hypothetical protein
MLRRRCRCSREPDGQDGVHEPKQRVVLTNMGEGRRSRRRASVSGIGKESQENCRTSGVQFRRPLTTVLSNMAPSDLGWVHSALVRYRVEESLRTELAPAMLSAVADEAALRERTWRETSSR